MNLIERIRTAWKIYETEYKRVMCREHKQEHNPYTEDRLFLHKLKLEYYATRGAEYEQTALHMILTFPEEDKKELLRHYREAKRYCEALKKPEEERK